MSLRSTALQCRMLYVSLFACGAALLIHRARRRQKEKIGSTSGGPFAKRPREMLVWILEFFTMYEVAQLQRLVCREFRDAGQERIRERGGRKLFEEGIAYPILMGNRATIESLCEAIDFNEEIEIIESIYDGEGLIINQARESAECL